MLVMQGRELLLFLQEAVPGSQSARGMPHPSTAPPCRALLRITHWCWGHWGRWGHWGCQGWWPSPLGAGDTQWPARPPAPFSPQPRASQQPSPFLGKKKPNLGSFDMQTAKKRCHMPHGTGLGTEGTKPPPGRMEPPSTTQRPPQWVPAAQRGSSPTKPPSKLSPVGSRHGQPPRGSHSSPAPWGPGTPLCPPPWGSPTNGFSSSSITGGLGVPRDRTAASSHAAPWERLQRDPRQKCPPVPKWPQNARGEAAPGGARAQGGSGDLQAAPPAG